MTKFSQKYFKKLNPDAQKVEYFFEYIFRAINHLIIKIGQLIDTVMGTIFEKNLHHLEEWVLNLDPFN